MAFQKTKPHRKAFICGVFTLLLTGVTAHAFDVLEFRTPGAGKSLEKDIRAASLLLAAKHDGMTAAQDVFAAALAEYGRLVGALYAQGHYSPVINIRVDGREAAEIAPLDAPSAIRRIEVVVDPGPAFVFSTARVAPLAKGTVLPEGFAPGKKAKSGLILESVGAGVDGWRAQGHAKAAPANQSITADHARQTLAADITLAAGPRLRFGPLSVTGQDRMRQGRIRKIAGLPEGEVFDPEALRRSAERLRRTGVFRSVTLTEADTISDPDLLGITAAVVEDKPRRYSLGAEIASFDGLELSGAWMHRNLFGGAERLTLGSAISNIGAQASGVDYKLGVRLDRPATFSPDTTLGFKTDFEHLNEDDYNGDLLSVGVDVSHYFSEKLTVRAGVEFNASNVNDFGGQTRFRNLALPLGLTWDNRDVKLDASKGFFLNAEAKPFLGFNTTDSGARLTMDARAYKGFGADRPVVLAGRVQLGTVLGANLRNTPRDQLFYSGGAGTVRGQPYQSLGISILRAAGKQFQTGGLAFLAASGEVRAKVTDTIGIVGFVDVGHVGALDFFDDLGGWHSGAGIGLRYDTGFGPIRLDVAAPTSGNTGKGIQIYIGVGQSF
ncbi:MAG: autotransporter assembly complex family protein [Paracoccaceae bacterium]|nr:autotransporter assembly complex family protein [Paracoccaceae bacterium]